jgi:hypothetical protein
MRIIDADGHVAEGPDPELPRDPNGKLYKRGIGDRYWQGRTSRIV